MKLNISFPAIGCRKFIEVDDEHKLHTFYEKHMATEVAADALGKEWKGYMVRISGGNDKQGFPMKQGVFTHGRVCLLLSKGHSCYRPRRTGERKLKSVWGCIVDANLSVLNLVIVKKRGELFNLSKEDDVHQYIVRKTKAPKIQRLVTPRVLQHKRRRIEEAAEYAKLLEQIAKRQRLSSLRASTSESSEK
ncbi:unnamed protein product [Nyctereutes procyonoides]|uniref:Small ribosomal subunit protein eS6 n=1 Tax=Nyctereutes procyonoides TaxID=34880 RepID=A0A811YXD2_NYCPR|nr:unnamed protein product [Nyctereutes procyonoides]